MARTLYSSVYDNLPYYAGRGWLTRTEMEVNARSIAQILSGYGWSVNAIAGILGNMWTESYGLNSDIYYGDKEFSAVSYGLVQWDPTSKYQDWADDRGYYPYHDIYYQCTRIKYEFDNGIQYYNRNYGTYKPYYKYSRSAFIRSTDDPYILACAFAWNYERSAVVLNGSESKREALRQERGGQAREMYYIITGQEWGYGGDPDPELPPVDPDIPPVDPDPDNPDPEEPEEPEAPQNPEAVMAQHSNILNLILWNRRPQIRVVR